MKALEILAGKALHIALIALAAVIYIVDHTQGWAVVWLVAIVVVTDEKLSN